MVRIEAGALHRKIEPVDLAEAVASALHDLGTALHGHPVNVEIAADLPFVLVDPQLFHHCLINLIENAAKYGDPGTGITVRAHRDPQGLTLFVEDEGPGIPAGQAQRIFETFARIEDRTARAAPGWGLRSSRVLPKRWGWAFPRPIARTGAARRSRSASARPVEGIAPE
jgi:two-component system sensor histidine kinase KdpD